MVISRIDQDVFIDECLLRNVTICHPQRAELTNVLVIFITVATSYNLRS